ncbi:MAG TPA: ATP-grasp domain-containing protein [Firmicutes bacterium]|nr:ATP-grasp domain-containing protein [Bacillota bacterium]
MSFVVGLSYNLKRDCPRGEGDPEDVAAEYEEKATVSRIARALRRDGHKVVMIPYGPGLLSRVRRTHLDIVFNIAEGWSGRNREAHVPAILETCGIPYTGSDALTLSLALDKALAKTVVKASGIPTPRFMLVHDEAQVSKSKLAFPVFVKPAYEGSSKGIRDTCKVETYDDLKKQVSWILSTYREPVLVEEFLPGREFTVGILGNNEDLTVFPIMEVRPKSEVPAEAFVYSYETKSKNLDRFLCPAPIPQDLTRRIRNIAVRAFRALGCRDMARVDIRLDSQGKPHFLEINPLPGLSSVSLFPIAALAAGIGFDDLINRILALAAKRYGLSPEACAARNVGTAAGSRAVTARGK